MFTEEYDHFAVKSGEERKYRGWARTWKRAELEALEGGESEKKVSLCRAFRQENEFELVNRFGYSAEMLAELYA